MLSFINNTKCLTIETFCDKARYSEKSIRMEIRAKTIKKEYNYIIVWNKTKYSLLYSSLKIVNIEQQFYLSKY